MFLLHKKLCSFLRYELRSKIRLNAGISSRFDRNVLSLRHKSQHIRRGCGADWCGGGESRSVAE